MLEQRREEELQRARVINRVVAAMEGTDEAEITAALRDACKNKVEAEEVDQLVARLDRDRRERAWERERAANAKLHSVKAAISSETAKDEDYWYVSDGEEDAVLRRESKGSAADDDDEDDEDEDVVLKRVLARSETRQMETESVEEMEDRFRLECELEARGEIAVIRQKTRTAIEAEFAKKGALARNVLKRFKGKEVVKKDDIKLVESSQKIIDNWGRAEKKLEEQVRGAASWMCRYKAGFLSN